MVSMKRASISDDGISGNWISMMRRVMAMAKIPSLMLSAPPCSHSAEQPGAFLFYPILNPLISE